jgi:hypothetical protein
MRRLFLLGSSLLALLACGDDTTSGGGGGAGVPGGGGSHTEGGGGTGGGGGDAAVTRGLDASWSISVQGIGQDCFFAGASWVDFAIEDSEGAVDTVRFACENAAGTTALEPGSYSVRASLVTFDEATITTGEAIEVTVEEDLESVSALFDLPGARISGTWTISQGGEPSTCDEAGAHRVEILANSPSGFAYSNTFECPLGEGVTDYFPLGEYEVFVSLLYEQDVVLVTSDAIAADLSEAGATVEIEPVDFVLQDP